MKNITIPTLKEEPLARMKMNACPVPVREGESAICSLMEGRDGRIYGLTSGRNCHIFCFCNVSSKNIALIGTIPGPVAPRAIAMDENRNIYVGVTRTLPDGTSQGEIFTIRTEAECAHWEEAVGETAMHILKPLELLTRPVIGEGLVSMIYHEQTGSLLGVTSPGTILFKYDLARGQCSTIAAVSAGVSIVERRRGRLISKTLVADSEGVVYGTGESGHFFRYIPESDDVGYLPQRIPSLRVRSGCNVAECLFANPDGMIYGGTTDGFLFGFSPREGKVSNFGKPSLERPIRGITVSDNVIYGVCGDNDGIADLFSYDLSNANFTDLGMINYIPCEGGPCDTVSRSPWSAWRIGAVVKDGYGTLYFGEEDSKGHLITMTV